MKIGIIGGGPAGMMAAIKAAESGAEVSLFEKNEKLGKKLFLTGKGRCNICNNCQDQEFFEQVVRNPRFLYSSFYTLPPSQLIELFEGYGLALKEERGRRIFPKSDRSSDVIKVLRKRLEILGVKILYRKKVGSIFYKEYFYLKTENESYKFDQILLATGGITYPSCGSTGEGYEFARKLGHSLVPARAGLVGLRTDHHSKNKLAGLSLRNISLTAVSGSKKETIFGDLLFTHYGVSGPVSLSMSSKINRWKDCQLFLDLKPALSNEKLEKRIIREVETGSNKKIRSVLENMLPKSLVNPVLTQAGLDGDLKAHQLKKEDRKQLTQIFKNYPLAYKGLFDQATGIITSGGIDIKEVNPSSLESKILPGLFFAGEILDVDAFTGGYNLQIAFSTGFLAGISMGKKKNEGGIYAL